MSEETILKMFLFFEPSLVQMKVLEGLQSLGDLKIKLTSYITRES